MSGVTPCALAESGSAFARRSAKMPSGRPSRDTRCNAVLPSESQAPAEAPASSASRKASRLPDVAASRSASSGDGADAGVPGILVGGERTGSAAGPPSGESTPPSRNNEAKLGPSEAGGLISGLHTVGTLPPKRSRDSTRRDLALP
eukprot:scaffold14794_cov96-Isochrysis_galbana.AAC.6